MTYAQQADLSRDEDFRDRIAAVVATQPWTYTGTPLSWAEENQWQIAAAPGFADSYGYAVDTGVDRPGRDPAVITDADLLAAVQARWAQAPPPAAPTHDHPGYATTGHTHPEAAPEAVDGETYQLVLTAADGRRYGVTGEELAP